VTKQPHEQRWGISFMERIRSEKLKRVQMDAVKKGWTLEGKKKKKSRQRQNIWGKERKAKKVRADKSPLRYHSDTRSVSS